jgi:hypothetical protein
VLPSIPDLFSDLNQWMPKILVGQRFPEALISTPRTPIRNASQLAAAAGVSVMSASRLVNQLKDRGFLHEGEDGLRIMRIEDLLDLWISANRNAGNEIPARWMIKQGQDQLQSALRAYGTRSDSRMIVRRKRPENVPRPLPRCCLGLFAAAGALGLGFVRGVLPRLYLERLTPNALSGLGLILDGSGQAADIHLCIPANREAIFRASLIREGVPVSDVLQVWLDASVHPARGREQAQEIQRRVLKPLMERPR